MLHASMKAGPHKQVWGGRGGRFSGALFIEWSASKMVATMAAILDADCTIMRCCPLSTIRIKKIKTMI